MGLVSISASRNRLPTDKSGRHPFGLRIGTLALTTRGLVEEDFLKVAEFFHRALQLSLQVQKVCGLECRMVGFIAAARTFPELEVLREEVEAFAKTFSLPGHVKI